METSVSAISNDECQSLMPSYFELKENLMCATDSGESFCRADAGDGGRDI